ncbi:MAG: radical SAM protein, partial [Candidatus Aminicenantes bacterium]|nr:radical SAM protein [Candidatus Aminicenantes bacterium]
MDAQAQGIDLVPGEITMKPSTYNFFFPIDEKGNYLAFNSLKNGLAVFPGKLVEILQSFQPGDTLSLPESTLADLKKGGFICDDLYDEYGMLLVRRHLQQYSGGETLGLTIAPTIFCNLSCSYCFESPQNKRMDAAVIAQIVEFVKKRITTGLKSLHIVLYGGEPLLCLDIIEELSTRLIELCDQEGVKYKAHIITNGTLFTRAAAEKLKSLKVTGAQITIDGDKEMHDARRPYRNGKGSFDRIFANIIDTAGIIPIDLRVNIDRQNVDTVLEFFKKIQSDPRLETHFKNNDIKVHYGYVRKFTASCRCSDEECLKPGDFWLEELKLH